MSVDSCVGLLWHSFADTPCLCCMALTLYSLDAKECIHGARAVHSGARALMASAAGPPDHRPYQCSEMVQLYRFRGPLWCNLLMIESNEVETARGSPDQKPCQCPGAVLDSAASCCADVARMSCHLARGPSLQYPRYAHPWVLKEQFELCPISSWPDNAPARCHHHCSAANSSVAALTGGRL